MMLPRLATIFATLGVSGVAYAVTLFFGIPRQFRRIGRVASLQEKSVLAAAVLATAVGASGCGPSQRDYDAAQKRSQELATQVAQLEREVDELRNGAVRRLGEAQAAFGAKKYEDVIKLSTALAEKHPGSAEARSAATLATKSHAHLEEQKRQAEAEAKAKHRKVELTAQQQARKVIRISRVLTDTPNSAGGVDLIIDAYNTSQQTIKYAWFSVTAFNAVGDPVRCSIRGHSEFTGKATGPVPPGAKVSPGRYWEAAWYNSTIVKGRLTGVKIEYIDGSNITLRGDDLKYIQY